MCTIRIGDKKRAALAAFYLIDLARAPISEVAMCLGQSDGSTRDAHYFYVHSTKKIVLRRHFDLIPFHVPHYCTLNVRPKIVLDSGALLPQQSPLPAGGVQAVPVQQISSSLKPISLETYGENLDKGLDEEACPVVPSSLLPEVVISPSVVAPVVKSEPMTDVVAPVVKSELMTSVQHVPIPLPSVVVSPVAPVVKSEPMTDVVTPVVKSGPLASVQPLPSPPPPVLTQRASSRVGRGVNRHLHFDNSVSPSQHKRKVALIAARARQREVFSDATWADIDSVQGPIAPPPNVSVRAFAAVPILKSGTPVHATWIAGSRRAPHRPSSPKPAFAPQLLRHLCFLAIMKDTFASLAALQAPGVSAFAASPMLSVDRPSTPPLSFSPKDNKEMSYRKGVKSMPVDEVKGAVLKELNKLFETHEALRQIDKADIRPDAVYIFSSMLLKTKYFADGTYDRVAARLAADGKDQPEGSYD
jgi:hypothetical protein